MGGGLESRCVGRVYGEDGAARHRTHDISNYFINKYTSHGKTSCDVVGK